MSDAGQGLALPDCDLAIAMAIKTAREMGVCFAGVTNSHHCGVLVDHLRAVADAGLVGLGFANSPAAMPAAGGKHPVERDLGFGRKRPNIIEQQGAAIGLKNLADFLGECARESACGMPEQG